MYAYLSVFLLFLLLELLLPLLASLGEHVLDHGGGVEARHSVRAALLEQPEPIHVALLPLLRLGRRRAALWTVLHGVGVEEVGEVVALMR